MQGQQAYEQDKPRLAAVASALYLNVFVTASETSLPAILSQNFYRGLEKKASLSLDR